MPCRATQDEIKRQWAKTSFSLSYVPKTLSEAAVCTCPHGHTAPRILRNIQRGLGSGCLECSSKGRSERRKHSKEFEFKALCKKIGYDLLTPYDGAQAKVKVRCPNGHERHVKPTHMTEGHRCQQCYFARRRDSLEVRKSKAQRRCSDKRYVPWRRAVHEKHDNTCQSCLLHISDGAALVAHHVYNYKEYPQLRYDIDNGITLCDTCHSMFHGRYGNRKHPLTDK